MKKIIVLIFTFLSFLLSPIQLFAQAVDPAVTELLNDAEGVYSAQTWASRLSGTDNVMIGYYTWTGLDGLMCTYEITGDTKFIEDALAVAQRYPPTGQRLNSDSYLDWYQYTSTSPTKVISNPHFEVRAADGLAVVAAMVFTNPELSVYRPKAQSLVNFLEFHVWQKYNGGYNNFMSDPRVTHFVARNGTLAIYLYEITGKREYLDYAIFAAQTLKSSFRLVNGTYIWGDYLDFRGERVVDTSHAGDTVNFIVEAYRRGIVFNDTDIQRLINTVKINMWNGSTTAPKFANYIDGSMTGGVTWLTTTIGRNMELWVKLAQFDPQLQSIFYTYSQSSEIWPADWNKVNIWGCLARAIHQSGLDPIEIIPGDYIGDGTGGGIDVGVDGQPIDTSGRFSIKRYPRIFNYKKELIPPNYNFTGFCEDGGLSTAIGCIPFDQTSGFTIFFVTLGIGIGGGIAFLVIVYAGFMLMTSSGDPRKMRAAKQLLLSAIGGIILLILSVFIIRVLGVNILGVL